MSSSLFGYRIPGLRCLSGGTDYLGQQGALTYHPHKCWELWCYHPQKGGVQLTPCDPICNITTARFADLYDRQGSYFFENPDHMSLRIGQILRGNKWNYRLVKQLGVGDKTVTSHVFKAKVLPGVESVVDPRKQWYIY